MPISRVAAHVGQEHHKRGYDDGSMHGRSDYLPSSFETRAAGWSIYSVCGVFHFPRVRTASQINPDRSVLASATISGVALVPDRCIRVASHPNQNVVETTASESMRTIMLPTEERAEKMARANSGYGSKSGSGQSQTETATPIPKSIHEQMVNVLTIPPPISVICHYVPKLALRQLQTASVMTGLAHATVCQER